MSRPAVPIAEKNPFLTGERVASNSFASMFELGHEHGPQDETDELEEGEDEQEGSECSEDSAESEYAVDETVREEMAKLEDTFREIGMKFRMIARIGEGNAIILVQSVSNLNYRLTGLSRNFLDCLQGRRHAL